MPRKGISYEQVAKACNELEKSQRLSVRAIQAKTGGSMTTVLKHYRRWQRARSGQPGVETVISDRLRHALLSELEEAAAHSRYTVQQELQEAQQHLAGTKKEADKKQHQLTQLLKQVSQQKYLLEQKKEAAERRAAAAEKQLRSAQSRINIQKKALLEEQSKRRASEEALQQIQGLKQKTEDRLLEPKQSLQDSAQEKKVTANKKRGKKVEQSLFDF